LYMKILKDVAAAVVCEDSERASADSTRYLDEPVFERIVYSKYSSVSL